MSFQLRSQEVILEGYAFESDNRGYLNAVKVVISPKDNASESITVFSNKDGFFTASVGSGSTYTFTAEKDLFHPVKQDFSTVGKAMGEKVFLKAQLARQPGYMFDVTLAEERTEQDTVVDAIEGAWIEIYNNTTEEEVLNLKDYPDPNFNYTFQQGNHYTLMIRKEGYFSKRLEAYVNVDGCILCFDGLASLENVTDNLTEGHEMGSLLANIELKRANPGDKFTVRNILYEYNSADITTAAASELNNLADILEDNPDILVELGSHTDSRGKTGYNQKLSQERAQAAVAHLILQGIDPSRIVARGYGESDLLNECGDKSDCTEEEHAENRRTEIKVLGFLNEEKKEKTLVTLKEEEKFADLLRQVQDQEQVQVGEGEELPESVKEEMEEATEEAKEAEVEAAEEVMEEEANVAPEAELEGKQDGIQQEVSNRAEMSETQEMGDAEGELHQSYTVYPDRDFPGLDIPNDYSGFMIQVLKIGAQVGSGHPIFEKYDQVYREDLADGDFGYLIGSFGDIQEALMALDADLLQLYPKAQIIEYIAGVRK